MRMLLNQDGTINALGYVPSYPDEAPVFVTHLRWQYNGGDMTLQSNWTELPPTEDPQEIDIP